MLFLANLGGDPWVVKQQDWVRMTSEIPSQSETPVQLVLLKLWVISSSDTQRNVGVLPPSLRPSRVAQIKPKARRGVGN